MRPKNNHTYWVLLVFLTSFTLYVLTLPNTNVGYGDSDMLISVGYGGGVAHPPGYPLFIALTWIFTHLPLSLTIAARAHLLSAVLSSLTLTLIFLSVNRFIVTLKFSFTNIIALLSTFSLAILFPYWLYSIIAEKYALNLLLASLLIYLSLRLITSKVSKPSLFIIYCFLIGISLTTHLTLWFLLPMISLTLYYRRPKLKYLLALLIGIILPLSFLWYLNLRSSPPLSWHFPASVSGLFQHATMQAYFKVSPEIRPLTPTLLTSTPNYLKYLALSYGYVPLFLAVFGLLILTRKPHSPQKNVLLAGTIFTLILIPLIVKWPNLYSGQATAQRQYLIGYLFLPLLFALGLSQILDQVKKYHTKIILMSLITSALIIRLVYLFPQINLKVDTNFPAFYKQVLTEIPLNSKLFCFSDVSCFALLFDQTINRHRSDVVIIPESYQLIKLPLPKLTQEFVDQNLPTSNIYFIDLTQKYFDQLGFDYGRVYLSPAGFSNRLSATPSATVPPSTYPYTEYLLTRIYSPADPVRLQRLAGAAQRHLVNAMTAKIRGDLDTFNSEKIYAQKLTAKLPTVYLQGVNQVVDLYQNNIYPKAKNQYFSP